MKNIYKILYGLVSTVVFLGYKIESLAATLRLTITSSAVVSNCSTAEYPAQVRANVIPALNTQTWCTDTQYLTGCTSANGTFVGWNDTNLQTVCMQTKNYACADCADLDDVDYAENAAGATYIEYYGTVNSTFTTCGTQYFSGGLGTMDDIFALRTGTSTKRVYYKLTNGADTLYPKFIHSCYLPTADGYTDTVGTFSMASDCFYKD